MSKKKDLDSDENSKVVWSYNGAEEEWDSFDRRMIRFMRKRLDDFGEKLWLGEVLEVGKVKSNSSEFANHCVEVYHAISVNDLKLAQTLYKKKSDFWKRGWHVRWIKRQ
jgi:hypothetical protein